MTGFHRRRHALLFLPWQTCAWHVYRGLVAGPTALLPPLVVTVSRMILGLCRLPGAAYSGLSLILPMRSGGDQNHAHESNRIELRRCCCGVAAAPLGRPADLRTRNSRELLGRWLPEPSLFRPPSAPPPRLSAAWTPFGRSDGLPRRSDWRRAGSCVDQACVRPGHGSRHQRHSFHEVCL